MRLAAIALGISCVASAHAADRLRLTDPRDSVRMEMALDCASTDTRAPQYYFWTGAVFARRAGEADRLLFNGQGVNPRACRLVEDAARGGTGYQAAARELMLHLDPATNEVLATWRNPWTDETVAVIQMENDPASIREARFALDAAGKPVGGRMQWEDMGQANMATRTSSFFRDSPLGGDYQAFVGGKHQVMETSTFTISKRDVAGFRAGRPLPYTANWVRLSGWPPWMKMGGREGQIVLVTNGRSTMQFDELPEPLRSTLMARYPQMRETPSFDHRRPFQTSWDSLKKALDPRRRE